MRQNENDSTSDLRLVAQLLTDLK